MMTAKRTATVRIMRDSDPPNPRKEWDHVGRMVCWHHRYNLGDEQPRGSVEDWLRRLADDLVGFKTDPDDVPMEHVMAVLVKHVVMLPLYLYDHGGITMSTSQFSCPWDSGQVGWIYVTWEKARQEYGEDVTWETVRKCLTNEVETYDAYLTGEVYGYEMTIHEDDEEVASDSCWGYYGWDHMRGHMRDEIVEVAGHYGVPRGAIEWSDE